MAGVVERVRSRLWASASMLALAIGVAGCSGDATRFNDNPYARESTGTVQAAPAGHVESRPLPPAQQQQPPASRPATVATQHGVVGGGRGLGSYTPPSGHAPQPQAADVTGSVAAKPAGSWTWDGGTAITVAQGDTVETISRKYGVPASAILQANNLVAPATLYAGQQLVIPRYQSHAAAAPAASAPRAAAPVKPVIPPAPAGNPGVHVVAAGETLSKIARLYGKSVGDIAKANNIQPTASLKIGERLVIPGVRVSAKSGSATAQAAPAKEPASEPTHSVSLVSPTETPSGKDAVKSAEAAGSLPTFRWPVQGRIIAGFGSSPNGSQNDGINLAVPEGTPVKAAEDGVVAYAGNELKGYGNLVLIRHPNGYVTAYAHAKELMVKRGDQIKRGQVIAKSGQTGNVNAPQLHFEIRKGATPLDPMRFLKGA
jgi:murein DD-endopeptidase MepM/ murein hydrolase activator NlpD